MKVLFLHLSDMHFSSELCYSQNNCQTIVDAVSPSSIGTVDAVFLLITGDLAFSGLSAEYEHVYRFVGILRRLIFQDIKIRKYNFYVFVVPGNHDRNYSTNLKTRSEYERSCIGGKKLCFENEFQMQNAFFDFSQKERCAYPKESPFLLREVIELDKFKFEINMLNTAPFSIRDEDDRGLHFLPSDVLSHLESPSGADFVVTLMHHSYQNFNDSMRAELERVLFSRNSMIFCGHDHHYSAQCITYNDADAAALYCGGALSNRGNWEGSEFFACVLDTKTFDCTRYSFKYDTSLYRTVHKNTSSVSQKPSFNIPGNLQKNYVSNIFSDNQYGISDSTSDYFVFPRLRLEMTNEDSLEEEISTMDSFIKEVEAKKHIAILGESGAGKTTLLKQLFRHYCKKKIVLFCSLDEITSGNRKRILKSIFQDIYGSDELEYEKFERTPSSQKILLVDDIHLIKSTHLSQFMEGIESEFDYIIYTSDSTVELDIQERIKTSIEKDQYVQMELLRFYTDKREELIKKVVYLRGLQEAKQDEIVATISGALKKQRRYISLTPNTILQYISYYIQNQSTGVQTDGNIFGKVFEASITTAIQRYIISPLSVEKIFVVLDKIAFHAHSRKLYPIPYSEIVAVIEEYCVDYGSSINIQDFMNVVTNAKIIHTCVRDSKGNLYKFINNNYLSYFIAREIRRRCVDNDYDSLTNVLSYACFGINSTILMFITYLTDDLTLLHQILEQALTSSNEWEEFEFGTKELSYLASFNNFSVSSPTITDKKKDDDKELEKDRSEVDTNSIDTINIYDYDEKDLRKLTNKLSRSLSLLMTIARCFPNFEHIMKKADKELFIKGIYQLPNKIFYAWAHDIETNKNDLIEFIVEIQTNEFGRQDFSDADALRVLQWESMSLLLELYYSSIVNAYKPNSYEHLLNKEFLDFGGSDTYRIERSLVFEIAGKTDLFIDQCADIYDKSKADIKNTLVLRMVRHLLMTSKKISSAQIHRANSLFFPQRNNADILMLRNRNAEK